MIKVVLILGGIATFAVFLITVLMGIGTADRDGRIPMPGEKALTLESGKYGIYYEEAGNGTPILFIHEFGGDHRSWDDQMRHFGRGWRCVT